MEMCSPMVGFRLDNSKLFQLPHVWPYFLELFLSCNKQSPVVFLLLLVFHQEVAGFALSLRKKTSVSVSHTVLKTTGF